MSDLASAWAARRPSGPVLHLDSAAAGRQSRATLDAAAAHTRLEAEVGAYVAQERAAETLDRLRADAAGLFGVPADGVAFVESATLAFVALLDAWKLPAGARVGVVRTEWGPNEELLVRRGLRPVELASDADGRLDVAALRSRLANDPPDVVQLTQVTSHRALVQPVAEAVALCRAAGVPVWVDAAQALGHLDVATGADAMYAPSRKWLAGPRGVGVLAVAESAWDRLDVLRPAMLGDDAPPVRCLESHEAHIAGRVGLATAVAEFVADGPAAVYARLAEVGRQTRAALGDLPGWIVADGPEAAGAITALRPTGGQDVFATRARLLAEQGIVTTAAGPARAPRDMHEPLLRISAHVDLTPEALDRLRAALID